MHSLDALADSRIRDDRKPRKCERCKLTTYDPIGLCASCARAPLPAMKWFAVVMSPSLLECTFIRKGGPCGNVAVAVQHGRNGMTGKHGCAECLKRNRIGIHVGKDGYSGSHSIYKKGNPPSTAFVYRRRVRLRDAA